MTDASAVGLGRRLFLNNLPPFCTCVELQCHLQSVSNQSIDVYDMSFCDPSGVVGVVMQSPTSAIVQILQSRQNMTLIALLFAAHPLRRYKLNVSCLKGDCPLDRKLADLQSSLIAKLDCMARKMEGFLLAVRGRCMTDEDRLLALDEQGVRFKGFQHIKEHAHRVTEDNLELILDMFKDFESRDLEDIDHLDN